MSWAPCISAITEFICKPLPSLLYRRGFYFTDNLLHFLSLGSNLKKLLLFRIKALAAIPNFASQFLFVLLTPQNFFINTFWAACNFSTIFRPHICKNFIMQLLQYAIVMWYFVFKNTLYIFL